MPKQKWRNVSDRTVAGVKPGGTINRFPDGTNVRALVRAGSIVEILPKKLDVEEVADGNDSP